MNANELADELEELHQADIIDGVADQAMPKAATMLRHLQSENDLLKAQVKRLKEIIEKSIDMNNALGKM